MTTSALDQLKLYLSDRYIIDRELGHGAMATVYLAHDTKHHRDVAVKVLRPDLTALVGPDRFLNEIEVVAHLHHPHILPLFDSGRADDLLFYVTPRIEGESLRERLQRERQLPVEEAVAITTQVAAALDYAHRHNVIHRDVKPGNILLQDGQALVADFGIALALSQAAGDRLTATGLSLGTPGYMSPEQATGERALDARSDIYSLGAVLYEMLAGDPPHVAPTAHATLTKTVMEVPKPVRQFRDTVPRHIDEALSRALAKVPADRYRSAAEFSRALTASAGDHRSELTPPATGEARSPQITRRHLTRWQFVAVGGWSLAIAAAAFAWTRSQPDRGTADLRSRRWEITLPTSAPLAFIGVASLGVGRTSLALSPDATHFVYVARRGNTTQLYHRALDKLEVTPLPGTDGAYNPFFSPDGRWVAFFAGYDLKKVSVAGGQVITLAQVDEPMGGVWSPDGRILVGADQGRRPGWIPEVGGAFQPITVPPEAARWRFPQLLPDREWVLHTGVDRGLYLSSVKSGRAFAITTAGVVPRESSDASKILYGRHPLYSKSGHILYFSGSDGVLMALPFDADRRRVLGAPTPVLEGVRQEAEAGAGQLVLADDGTLLYAPGTNAELSVLVWVDRQGRIDTLPFPRAAYGPFDVSPNGNQILVRTVSASGRAELWILDVDRGSQMRVPTRGVPLYYPRWWPDGKRLIFGEFTASGGAIAPTVRQSATDAAQRDTLVEAGYSVVPSPDGSRVAVSEWRGEPGLWLLPVSERSDRPARLLSDATNFPCFSPDGRWLAYTQRGPSEVYVIGTEPPYERHKISLTGGEEGLWSPRGDEIIYRNRQQWFAVDVSTTNGFRAGRPRLLFEGPYLNVPGWSHAISREGQRHLVLRGPPEEAADRLMVITNWSAELKRLAPAITR